MSVVDASDLKLALPSTVCLAHICLHENIEPQVTSLDERSACRALLLGCNILGRKNISEAKQF